MDHSPSSSKDSSPLLPERAEPLNRQMQAASSPKANISADSCSIYENPYPQDSIKINMAENDVSSHNPPRDSNNTDHNNHLPPSNNEGAEANQTDYWNFIRETSVNVVETFRRTAYEQYIQLRDNPKQGPVLIRFSSLIAAIILIIILLLENFKNLILLRPIFFIIDFYAILGCILILMNEWSKRSNRYHIKEFIHNYFGFLEFCVGLGCVELFVASLTLSELSEYSILFKYIPGLVIALCGLVNIIWGFYAGRKLRKIQQRLHRESSSSVTSEGEEGNYSFSHRLSLMERRFDTLDKSGYGFLTIEDLQEGLQELKIDMNQIETELIFQKLDTNKDGKISKEEFKNWWMLEKSGLFI